MFINSLNIIKYMIWSEFLLGRRIFESIPEIRRKLVRELFGFFIPKSRGPGSYEKVTASKAGILFSHLNNVIPLKSFSVSCKFDLFFSACRKYPLRRRNRTSVTKFLAFLSSLSHRFFPDRFSIYHLFSPAQIL